MSINYVDWSQRANHYTTLPPPHTLCTHGQMLSCAFCNSAFNAKCEIRFKVCFRSHHYVWNEYKKAELSQRWPRDAPNTWVPWKISRVPDYTPTATFPEICNMLLFWSILRTCVQNLKFVALPVPEIIGGTQKSWAVPRYVHAPFSQNFLMGFCSNGPFECSCQIWSS